MEDKGPILYSQERTGHRGMSFMVYKLRTMYVGAEKGGAQWAKKMIKELQKLVVSLERLGLMRYRNLFQFYMVI